MERGAYESMARIEGHHWWFVGRRAILSDIIRRSMSGASLKILEVGSGTGGNLEMLEAFGSVTGVEPDARARTLAAEKSTATIVEGRLPDGLKLEPGTYDLLAAFDVLEHIEDDVDGLRASVKCLKPGGKAIVTVPAFPRLWSYHDEQHHHKRRYTKASLEALVRASGLEIEEVSYFNTVLFVPAFLVRWVKKAMGLDSADVDGVPVTALNKSLAALFGFERFILRRHALPFGLSLVAVARVPEG